MIKEDKQEIKRTLKVIDNFACTGVQPQKMDWGDQVQIGTFFVS